MASAFHLSTSFDGGPVGVNGPLQRRDLPVQLRVGDVLVQHGPDGLDYLRVCDRHQWVGRGVPQRSLLETCPACDVEADVLDGQVRYLALSVGAR